jgi:signal recognition particle subunit SRP54
LFEGLSSRLRSVTDALRGKGRLTEENIRDAVRDVRRALIEADAALPVIKDLMDRVQERALGTEISRSVTPGQAFIAILQQELIHALGEGATPLDLKRAAPVPILMVGLQGGGKTTSSAKLALFITQRLHRRVMLVSLDTRRPAAILQLERLAGQAGATFAPASESELPADIARRALDAARVQQAEVVIFDSAGRTRLDEELLTEIQSLQRQIDPIETLYVLDSMAGQDALNAARAFAEKLTLTGIVLTKTDGDTRGGAALSVRAVTGCPIKFLGTGEKLQGLEEFAPERMASRILGMGDMVGLVEEIGQSVDREKAERLSRKVSKGQGFDLADLREQLHQMLGMGGLESLLAKLPLPGGMQAEKLAGQVDQRAIRRQIGIIDSMTPQERRFPKNINGSRKLRIAAGSGVAVPEVNRLLKQHEQMQKMMKRLSKGGLGRALRGMAPPRGPRGF